MKLTNIIEKEYDNLQNNTLDKIDVTTATDIVSDIFFEWYQQFSKILDEKLLHGGIILYGMITLGDDIAKNCIKNISYTTEEITKFSLRLEEIEKRKLTYFKDIGIFLSSIIANNYNKKNAEKYLLFTQDITTKINYIGFKNSAHMVICGNVGHDLGINMNSGSITVTGNAATNTGSELLNGIIHIYGNCEGNVGENMKGGEIIVDSKSGSIVGSRMQGGKITIKGNTHDYVGEKSTGGQINLLGEWNKAFMQSCEGDAEIYHRGKREYLRKKFEIK